MDTRISAAPLSGALERFLREQRVEYSLLTESAATQRPSASGPEQTAKALRARAVPLEDDAGIVIAVLPAARILDIARLCTLLDRQLEPLAADRFREVFVDCDAGCCPPLGRAYNVVTAVDVQLYTAVSLLIESGRRQSLLQLATRDFQRLMQTVALGRFSLDPNAAAAPAADASVPDLSHIFPARAAQTLRRCDSLPPLPETARRLLELASEPHASAEQLADAIETDAAVAARILCYANSSFYGFPGRIADLQGAIARVLGFDVAMGIAIAMCLGKDVRIAQTGPLGLEAYRRHSVYCATLTAQLARQAPKRLSLNPGKAYLAGLLHNLGMLFLGQMFPDQYRLLARTLAVNAHASLSEIEKAMLDSTHIELGARLLTQWHLPAEIVGAITHYQDETYRGEQAGYAHLIGLSLSLLEKSELLDYRVATAPLETLMELLDLDETQLQFAVATLFDHHEALDQLMEIAA